LARFARSDRLDFLSLFFQEVGIMVEIKRHKPGMFCSVELATRDGGAAKNFYTSLFRWGVDDLPIEGGNYTMLQKNGKQAGALYEMGPEQKGTPPSGTPTFA
jgi:predicted enzyme related to lactoylglutathione lyase